MWMVDVRRAKHEHRVKSVYCNQKLCSVKSLEKAAQKKAIDSIFTHHPAAAALIDTLTVRDQVIVVVSRFNENERTAYGFEMVVTLSLFYSKFSV